MSGKKRVGGEQYPAKNTVGTLPPSYDHADYHFGKQTLGWWSTDHRPNTSKKIAYAYTKPALGLLGLAEEFGKSRTNRYFILSAIYVHSFYRGRTNTCWGACKQVAEQRGYSQNCESPGANFSAWQSEWRAFVHTRGVINTGINISGKE